MHFNLKHLCYPPSRNRLSKINWEFFTFWVAYLTLLLGVGIAIL